VPVLPRLIPRSERYFPERGGKWQQVISYRGMTTAARGPIYETRLSWPAATAAAKGLRIGFFSDAHVMDNAGTREIIRAAAESFAAFDPDYLLCGGDFSGYLSQLESCWPLLAAFAPLRAVKLAVEGNWETRKEWIPHAYWRERFARYGFRLLKHDLYSDRKIAIYGMGDFDYPVPPPQWPDGPCTRLLLVHCPDVLVAAPGETPPFLALSGHTHGGQIRLPLIGPLATASLYGRRLDAGLFRHRDSGSAMLISTGLNHLSFPWRFGCRREVVLLTLI